MPMRWGITATMPPLTPLLAGMPTSWNHWPAASYIPQVSMTLRTSRTYSAGIARAPVIGLMPPWARVAPMSASSSVVTVTEQADR